jgi:cobalamin biosynthesis protein CbiG
MMTVGIGAVSGVSAEEVLAAVDAVLPAAAADVRLATLDARATEPGVVAAASRRGWPLTGHSAADLARVPVPSPSARVATLVGTASVAEAAALLGGGELVVGKTVHGRVTVAVAVTRSPAAASQPSGAGAGS